MRLIVYDVEVFCEDWLVVLKDMESGKYTVVHNDNEVLKQCITEDNIYVGFNSKHYDRSAARLRSSMDATPPSKGFPMPRR